MAHRKKTKRSLYDVTATQNFMTRRRLLQRIVNRSDIDRNDTVLEIGTGKGHLTQVLCQKSEFVHTIEIDHRLCNLAEARLAPYDNVKLIRGDFLQSPLTIQGAYKVFANIPYAITTPILKKLTEADNPPIAIWVVVEKGAAKRFMGTPRETKVSLLLKARWDLSVKYHFKREDFHPKPAVDSVLLHLARKDVPDVSDFASFERFISRSLTEGVMAKRGMLTGKQIRRALKEEKLPPLEKEQMPGYAQWLCLYHCFQRFNQ